MDFYASCVQAVDTVAGIRVDGSNELYVFMYGRFILILWRSPENPFTYPGFSDLDIGRNGRETNESAQFLEVQSYRAIPSCQKGWNLSGASGGWYSADSWFFSHSFKETFWRSMILSS